jgi:hypothetical protein
MRIRNPEDFFHVLMGFEISDNMSGVPVHFRKRQNIHKFKKKR